MERSGSWRSSCSPGQSSSASVSPEASIQAHSEESTAPAAVVGTGGSCKAPEISRASTFGPVRTFAARLRSNYPPAASSRAPLKASAAPSAQGEEQRVYGDTDCAAEHVGPGQGTRCAGLDQKRTVREGSAGEERDRMTNRGKSHDFRFEKISAHQQSIQVPIQRPFELSEEPWIRRH